MDYLEQVKKTGACRFRRGIPAHLRAYFPKRGVVWREHLGTTDYAEARVRCLEVSVRVEKLFNQAQARYDAAHQKPASSPTPIRVDALRRLATDWKAAERGRRAQLVVVGDVMPGWPEFLREANLAGVGQYKTANESPEQFMARVEAEKLHIDDIVRGIADNNALLIDEEHPAFNILRNLVRTAWIEVLEAEHLWRVNDFSDLPVGTVDVVNGQIVAPPSNAAARDIVPDFPVAVSTPSNPVFSVAFDEWIRLSRPAPRTITEAKTALNQFTELHGDLPVRSIQKQHARVFRDVLAKLPKNLTADQKKMPIARLLEQPSGQCRAPQTVNKTLNLLSGILSRQNKEGIFDDMMWKNPFSVHLDVEEEDEDSYEPLDDTDLRALFLSPVFAHQKRPKQGRGDTAFWAPLLVLFHGTRRQDVLQLFVRDIRKDPDTGVRFIDVNRDDGKKVKNGDSVRQIPLHPFIIQLGFLDWFAEREKKVGPDGSLWPGFEERSKLDGRINRWGKWFGDYLTAHVVDHPRKKLHSLRGTFKRVGRGCGVSDDVLSRICGHAIGSVGGKYGRKKRANGSRDSGYPLTRLSGDLALIAFPGQDQIVH